MKFLILPTGQFPYLYEYKCHSIVGFNFLWQFDNLEREHTHSISNMPISTWGEN